MEATISIGLSDIYSNTDDLTLNLLNLLDDGSKIGAPGACFI